LFAAFGAIYLIWGSTFLAIRFAIDTLPPLSMTGVRCLVAGLILYAYGRLRHGIRASAVHWATGILTGSMLFLVAQGGLAWAEQRVASGMAALLFTTMPLWMALLQVITSGARTVNGSIVAGLLLGLLGVALLLNPDLQGGEAIDLLGAAVILVGAGSWAVGSVLSSRLPHPTLLASRTGVSLIGGGVTLLLVGTAFGEFAGFTLDGVSLKSLLSLGYLILFGSVIAFAAYSWLLQRVRLTTLATHAYVNPAVAVALGTTLGHEPFTLRTVLAGSLVVGAVIMTLAGSTRIQTPQGASLHTCRPP
jgi:drug/metabolite transporter (DMT)-like permease